MSYWYRPNVLKRKWGSYGNIHNNQYYNDYNDYSFNNGMNNKYDPDDGEDEYYDEDDVDLHPDIYQSNNYFDPDNESERVNKPDLINEDYSKTEESIFDDPDYEEYNKEMNINDYPNEENEKEENELPLKTIVDPDNPNNIYTYDNNTIELLKDMKININNKKEIIKALQNIQDDIRQNNYENLKNAIKEEGVDNTIPVIEERGDDIIVQNIDYDEIKDKPMEEEIEIHKDEKEPDRNIIPPKPPKENRNTIKQWIDKNRDNSKRKHHLEDTNEYQEKRDFERGIKIEELQQFLPLEEKEEREEAINETKIEIPQNEALNEKEEVQNNEIMNNSLPNEKIEEKREEKEEKRIKKPVIVKKERKLKEVKKFDSKFNYKELFTDVKNRKREVDELEKRYRLLTKDILLNYKPTQKKEENDSKNILPEQFEPIIEKEEEDLRVEDIPKELTIQDQQKFWNNFKHNDENVDVNEDEEEIEEDIEEVEEPEIEYEYEYEF
ncbi:hypothetical protein CL6EHI_130510 [Entamoeba histolytica]|uniref:Uncharacterized protein n=2 Tax=Entamoeba histolytica TaxID=5759 RepID=C4MAR0_ENTH1|nr:hypothetical protein EHI_130510 [Entamoeba histolytica HM-1:IMSS]EAL43040.1 hypothetical protein EHI_130510 [Entamoeba histolytica HM-1:IMSS]GAT98917.1 hypothetical protein CL6EHI_130510 [Entamoeba histolytica]|eukprot:XP_648428.1 hypothetical protein EHI_130510 [Entamoeba histolytica HM-1:IMSS]